MQVFIQTAYGALLSSIAPVAPAFHTYTSRSAVSNLILKLGLNRPIGALRLVSNVVELQIIVFKQEVRAGFRGPVCEVFRMAIGEYKRASTFFIQ